MKPHGQRALVVMAKRPAPGVTKTRLTPTLTAAQAAAFYECLLLDTLSALDCRNDCDVVVAIDKHDSAEYFAAIAPDTAQVLQVGDALGDRLNAVMTECLNRGYRSVFAIGSDSPDLPASHVDDACAALDRDEVDVVLGPSDDGGYYLIGWKRPWSRLVTDVVMSTPRVLDDTLAIAAELNARVHLSPQWYDIDTPDDFDRMRASTTGDTSRSSAFLAAL